PLYPLRPPPPPSPRPLLSLHDALPILSNSTDLPCDGCGQAASAEHIARRLRRLEWATRFRPVHIHTLLRGGVAHSSRRNLRAIRSEEHTAELQSFRSRMPSSA